MSRAILLNVLEFVPPESKKHLEELFSKYDKKQVYGLSSIKLKDPNIVLTISFAVGFLGIDRFYYNDIFLGLVKLALFIIATMLTIDVFLNSGTISTFTIAIIFWIANLALTAYDSVYIYKAIKQENLEKIEKYFSSLRGSKRG